MVLTVMGVVTVPQTANAACANLLSFNFGECVTEGTAWVGNILLTMMSYLLTVTGTILSFSIKITLNIKNIYDGTPAINNVWVIVRNLSSMFIIFMLMYSSIQTILGIGSANVKTLIGKIIIAGLLINFSLFFTKVAIDASNLISMQFYRAIAPQSASQNLSGWSNEYYDGGLSDVFMSALKIQSIYHPSNTEIKNAGSKGEGTVWMSIIIATYGGVLLMLFAAISFLGASVAFTIRTGMLLLLMAFSPIYFAGMIFPKIKSDISDKWLKYLTNQLIFMPVYLLLMYVALTIVSDKGFMSFISSGNLQDNAKGSVVILIGICIQYFIAIFFINVPLIGALQSGAMGAGFAESMTKGLKDRIYKQPGAVASFAAQHGVGRGARAISERLATSNFAARNPSLAIMADKGLGKISGNAFGGKKGGYDKRVAEYVKERSEYATKRYGLTTDKKQDIEQATEKELKGKMAEWAENKNQKIKESENNASVAKDLLLNLEKENSRIAGEAASLQKEYSDAKVLSGEDSPLTIKIKDRLDEINKILKEKTKQIENSRQAIKNTEKEFEKANFEASELAKTRHEASQKIEIEKRIKKETREGVSEKFAENLDQDWNPFTREARKKAANAIRAGKLKSEQEINYEKALKDLTSGFVKKEDDDEKK